MTGCEIIVVGMLLNMWINQNVSIIIYLFIFFVWWGNSSFVDFFFLLKLWFFIFIYLFICFIIIIIFQWSGEVSYGFLAEANPSGWSNKVILPKKEEVPKSKSW